MPSLASIVLAFALTWAIWQFMLDTPPNHDWSFGTQRFSTPESLVRTHCDTSFRTADFLDTWHANLTLRTSSRLLNRTIADLIGPPMHPWVVLDLFAHASACGQYMAPAMYGILRESYGVSYGRVLQYHHDPYLAAVAHAISTTIQEAYVSEARVFHACQTVLDGRVADKHLKLFRPLGFYANPRTRLVMQWIRRELGVAPVVNETMHPILAMYELMQLPAATFVFGSALGAQYAP